MSKAKRGAAYIMVLAVAIPVLLLVLLAFNLANLSRISTARYAHFSGMYELATVSSEQALHVAEAAIRLHSHNAHADALAEWSSDLNHGDIALNYHRLYLSHLMRYVEVEIGMYEHEWELQIDYGEVTDVFSASTTILVLNDEIHINTHITKAAEHDINTQMTLRWENLDYILVDLETNPPIEILDSDAAWVVQLARRD